MNCTSPITIKRPGCTDKPLSFVKGFKPYRYETLVVGCGKCMACIQKRQNDYAFRLRAEAERRCSMVFVTLTYSEDNLPLVSTLWRSDKNTGECERLTEPEFVCYSRREDFYGYRDDFRCLKPTSSPRYVDVPMIEDDEYSYFTRITPSVCRKDVQNWLKRCRVYFERKENRKLDFSYSICSEYGPKSCRPHYHCCFLGLTLGDAEKFASLWSFGFYRVQQVFRVNSDGTDGFGKVASYVAKYVSKGDFRCESEKDCTAKSCRQMNSKGLGNSIVEKIRGHLLCYDMLGKYDPDTLFSETYKRYLNRSELVQLVAEVPKRLAVNYDGKAYYRIPRLIRNKIFYVEKISQDGKKKYSRPSKLWRMVVDHLQSVNDELDRREFARLLANKSPGEIAEAVSSFVLESENFSKTSNDSRKEDYKARLATSVF